MNIEEIIEKRITSLRAGLLEAGEDPIIVEEIVKNTREFIIKIGTEIIRIIESEREEGRLQILTLDKWDALLQIFESQILEITDVRAVKLPENFRATGSIDVDTEYRRTGEFIFVAAPTGAGKDSLVTSIISERKAGNERTVVLNVDRFRMHYTLFSEYFSAEPLRDKTFAIQTRDFSNEIYNVMERLILENFPGMNIIISGTLSDPEWVENAFRRIKAIKHTNYTTRLYGLIVGKDILRMSVIGRYLNLIVPQNPGTARYTSKEYLEQTISSFPTNFGIFERIFNTEPHVIDTLAIFRRAKKQDNDDISEFLESRKLYIADASDGNICDTCGEAEAIINSILNCTSEISKSDILALLEKVKSLKKYLEEQGVYREIIESLSLIFPNISMPSGLSISTPKGNLLPWQEPSKQICTKNPPIVPPSPSSYRGFDEVR